MHSLYPWIAYTFPNLLVRGLNDEHALAHDT